MMARHFLPPLFLALFVLGGLSPKAGSTLVHDGSAAPALAAADTLVIEHRVEAGQTLIFSLPEEHAGRAVSEYVSLRTPSMSWLQNRSFMWKTSEEDVGRHELLFLARFDDAREDSVRVRVDVEP